MSDYPYSTVAYCWRGTTLTPCLVHGVWREWRWVIPDATNTPTTLHVSELFASRADALAGTEEDA